MPNMAYSFYQGDTMAKRHHQSRRARFHEHAGEERRLHGYHLSPKAKHEEAMMHHITEEERMMKKHHSGHRKYDTLRHERDRFNDEHHHDAMPEKSGPYPYDRQVLDNRGAYEGYKGRRHQEMMDAGMIHEDHREIANLPQQVMIKPYPMTGPYLPEDLDDTIRGVDRQMDYDDSQKMMHFFPKKV